MLTLRGTAYVQNFTQIIAICIVSLTLLNEGMLICWPSSAIYILTNPDHPLKITKSEASYFSVLPCISLMLFGLPSAYLANKIGRRKTLMISTIPYFISGFLLGISNSLWVYYLGRFIHGFGSACSLGATPLYAAEISLPKVRGKWGNLLVINMYLGVLISYVVGSCFDLFDMSYFYMGIPVITLTLLFGIPESPYYLIMKKKDDEAKRSLQWCRQIENVEKEFVSIKSAVERQMASPSTYTDILMNKCNRKAMIAVLMSRFVQQFAGTLAILMYAHTFFAMAGTNFTVATSTITCGAFQLVFVIIGTMFNHKLGRRTTLFTSSIVCITLLSLMAIYFYIDSLQILDLSNWTWFPLVVLIGNLSAYAMGLSFIPTFLSTELFSSSVKEKAISITNIWYGALIASSSKIFQALIEYGMYVPFAFFAISCSTLAIVCYFVIPETKGKTLDEIQLAFLGKKNTMNVEQVPKGLHPSMVVEIQVMEIPE